MAELPWGKTAKCDLLSPPGAVENENAQDDVELSLSAEIGVRKRVPPTMYLFDRELNLVGSFGASGSRAPGAEPGDGTEPEEIVSIVRELAGRIETDWAGRPFGTLRGSEVLRVMPLRGSFSGYAVLIEADRRRDALRDVSVRFGLSAREFEVLALLVHGVTRSDISLKLGIAETTVQSHIQNLGLKLGCSRRGEIVARALGID